MFVPDCIVSDCCTGEERAPEESGDLPAKGSGVPQLNKDERAAAHLAIGVAMHEAGDIEKAVHAYQEAIQHDATAWEAYYHLACAQTELRQFAAARASFRKAGEIVPNEPSIPYDLGFLHLDLEEMDEAIACFRRVVELSPADAETWLNLGNAYRSKGMLAEGTAAYREALKVEPGNSMAYYNIGCAQLELFRTTRATREEDAAAAALREAIDMFQRAITAKKEPYEDAMYNLGISFQSAQRYKEAHECYDSVLRMSENADARAAKAYCEKKIKQLAARARGR